MLLEAALVPAPAGRVHLVLADNVDYANGFATPFPRNRVVIFATVARSPRTARQT